MVILTFKSPLNIDVEHVRLFPANQTTTTNQLTATINSTNNKFLKITLHYLRFPLNFYCSRKRNILFIESERWTEAVEWLLVGPF